MNNSVQKHLFYKDDEIEFKRQYVINFLSSLDAVKYNNGGHYVEDNEPYIKIAKYLAQRSWERWKLTIGLIDSTG